MLLEEALRLPSAAEAFASSAFFRPCALLPASFAISVSQGGESLPREATRSSILCEVALARAREAESRAEETDDADDAERSGEDDIDDGTNVADALGTEAANSAAPATMAARRTACFD